ncbi:alpha-L-fucosidase [Bacteroides sp.]|uniref:alpha-L-fucosidase n=1 Tax=Bacteroides sp. TaxID=29523 RepID=UPI0025BF110A|nr:alpha-L-fucosidase [Bacteroides sp.]
MIKRLIIQQLLAWTVCVFLITGCGSKETYYVKHVTFPEKATTEEKVDMASRLVPSPQQLAWQQMELTAFLHFGVNTFTGREWGDGKEDPVVFNPTELNAEQWAKALKDAGFKMAILTAKHHDGFCLWPTATTTHSVASSPWKDGKGDVVRELRNACDKYGLKFGVYLSPWDRHADCYGDSPKYNEYFIRQLTELLSNYGEIHEVWFDGACAEGPNGKKQEYDWEAFYQTIIRLQPHAVMAIMGDDVRWVGNEKGFGRETEWGATALVPGIYPRSEKVNQELDIMANSDDLGSRALVAKASELFWYPSEVDVSIRPGWFYHTEQDSQVKSLDKLVDIYFQSVGYNSVLLLNIPPDTRGLLHEVDVQRIKQLSDYLAETFAQNVIADKEQLWQGKPGSERIYELAPDACINVLMLQEDIARGQRIEGFRVEAEENGEWKLLGEGTTVGYKRLLRFADVHATRLRLTVTASRNDFCLSNVGVYYARPLDGQKANMNLSDVNGLRMIGDNPEMAKAVDGKRETFYRSETQEPLVIDCGKVIEITGFSYAPVLGDDLSGTIYTYNVYLSQDGKQWTKCDVSGEFSNIMHNPLSQFVHWQKQSARFLKLEPLTEIDGKQLVTIGEIGILTK